MTTSETIRLLLSSLQPGERSKLLRELAPATAPSVPNLAPRLIHAAEAARMLARSTRSIHMLAAAGYLQRITMPGRKRAGGFREADVLALMQSPEAKRQVSISSEP